MKAPPAPGAVMSPREWAHFVFRVFLPFALGYFLSYLFRSINALIAPDLTRELGLSAADLGLLTAAYFLSFSAFQLPLGVLLDRFGPRRVQGVLLLAASAGSVVFATGAGLTSLAMGRALIGVGVSGGLMASFTAITLWVPAQRWPLINGCFMTMGGLGALSATAPAEALLHVTDWRGLFFLLMAATAAASAMILLITPERPSGVPQVPLKASVAGLKRIFLDGLFWRLAPLAITGFGAGMSIQGLWAGPWLRDVAGLERSAVANGLMTIAGAMTVGFVATGLSADLFSRVKIRPLVVMAAGTLIFMLAQLMMVLRIAPGSWWSLALFGLFSNFHALCYPILSDHFPRGCAGRANTGLNLLVFLGAFSCQYAMGGVLDLWPGWTPGTYAPEGYQAAFGGGLVLQILAWVWFVLRRPREGPRDPSWR